MCWWTCGSWKGPIVGSPTAPRAGVGASHLGLGGRPISGLNHVPCKQLGHVPYAGSVNVLLWASLNRVRVVLASVRFCILRQ